MGQLVGRGALDLATAERRLLEAATTNGYVTKDGAAAARATVQSGLRTGMQRPRTLSGDTNELRPHRAATAPTINGAARDNGSMREAAEAPQSSPMRKVAQYIYRLADGTKYLRVDRYEPKFFPQYHWTGMGWEKGKPDGPKVPYRLPEMLAAIHDTVFVVEGEKDADALTALGFVATTSSEGAGKWTPDLNKWFAGKNVRILADNDKAGRNHARLV